MAEKQAAGTDARRTPELLAPAGGWEQLEYAVRFGADAVYLAAERFGMRQRADNFALTELPRVADYAHERGVTVHVTCNVVMHDDDLADLPAYFRALAEARVDAVIVSDLGALRLARACAPELAVHASTQASVANAQAALVWHELGARRIVCARELSLAQIGRMRAQLPAGLELEAFAHGSMCMAYSGRCLISDYLTGRSANGGHCTQPCRWSYTLEEAKRPGVHFPVEQDGRGSYILNAQDLCMLGHLNEMAAAGIGSVKIEGRNKKAFYVATVVNAYRQVLDGADPSDLMGELDVCSHRPYSTGFYFGPAHQAPASSQGEQLYDWVGDVLGCAACAGGTDAREAAPGADTADAWEAEVRCRNRFAEGDVLEVLSPGRPVRAFVARGLRWIPASAGEGGNPSAACDPDAPAQAAEVANRGMERYLLRCPFELHEHDILRLRRQPAGDRQ